MISNLTLIRAGPKIRKLKLSYHIDISSADLPSPELFAYFAKMIHYLQNNPKRITNMAGEKTDSRKRIDTSLSIM